jgi:hypothetical protein
MIDRYVPGRNCTDVTEGGGCSYVPTAQRDLLTRLHNKGRSGSLVSPRHQGRMRR